MYQRNRCGILRSGAFVNGGVGNAMKVHVVGRKRAMCSGCVDGLGNFNLLMHVNIFRGPATSASVGGRPLASCRQMRGMSVTCGRFVGYQMLRFNSNGKSGTPHGLHFTGGAVCGSAPGIEIFRPRRIVPNVVFLSGACCFRGGRPVKLPKFVRNGVPSALLTLRGRGMRGSVGKVNPI